MQSGWLRQTRRKDAVADFWMALARMLLNNRGGDEAWRLQTLTDLQTLPDYDRGWNWNPGSRGAPVDADGSPIFYSTPKSWSASQTDGERWRWALSQVAENNPQRLNDVRFEIAQFLESQFGVQTMAEYGLFFGRLQEDGAAASDGSSSNASERQTSSTWSLDTLGEDETMARLATGIKRFKLPPEFNFVSIYRQIVEDPATGHGDDALQHLAHIFENRRQYDKAADFWRRQYQRIRSRRFETSSNNSSIRLSAIGHASSPSCRSQLDKERWSISAFATVPKSASRPTRSTSKNC